MEHQAANNQLMQKMNRLKVLAFVRRHPGCSRLAISKSTGLSMSSLTNMVNYLLDLGILEECGTEQVGRVGRKSTLLQLNAARNALICAFVSGSQINLYVTDLLGEALEKHTVPTENFTGEEAVSRMTDSLRNIINSRTPGQILAVGVAVSGLILEDSRFVMSSELKWRHVDFKHILQQETGLPVFVDNNSQLRAAWYFRSCCKEKDNLLFLDLEGGIGAVQFAEGGVCRTTLGEIGHTTVQRDGDPCFCGNRGCLEAMCSVKRLLSLYETAQGRRPADLAEMEQLYRTGDPSAIFAAEDCGSYLGMGMANLVNLLNPSVLAVHTGSFTDCPCVLDAAERELNKRAFSALTEHLDIRRIIQTEDTMLSGMAQLLCDRVFDIGFEGNIIE